MNILGVTWDHPSGAGLLSGQKIIAAVNEERFSRKKNDISFPRQSIDFCKGILGKSPTLDAIGIATKEVSYSGMLYQYAVMPIQDHIREQNEVWYPRLYENKEVDDALVFKDRWVQHQYPSSYWAQYDPAKRDTYTQDSTRMIAEYAGVDPAMVRRIDHHWCHANYGYYFSPFQKEKAVVVTIDGFGDGLNATISIAENGRMRRIYETDICVLGRIYRHVTLLLGMKPLEHEYKVMGLAPYASLTHARPVYDILSQILTLDGIQFQWNQKPQDSYFYFKKKFEGYRFDLIAAGLQMWIEDMLCQWVQNIVKETRINRFVFCGGVSMNVKAMGKIATLPCVENMFVPGTGSDDSTCIGAAIGAYFELGGATSTHIISIPSLYLGPDLQKEDVQAVLAEAANNPQLIVETEYDNQRLARLLAAGFVIGRCVDRMEFGQRALGNRSILADPTISDIVPKINAKIKNRDFWMPFAPVIMESFASRYLINPKNISAPHMTIAFDTTDEGYQAMKAACHPADRTARAQVLTQEENPGYYAILEAFQQLTSRGALLNTSFNLHGFPIVTTPHEAYQVFLESGLDAFILPGGLILKKNALMETETDAHNGDKKTQELQHTQDFKVVSAQNPITQEHYQRSRQRWEHHTKTLQLASAPLHVDIELTNACHLNCIMCERKLMKRPIGMMTMEAFKKTIDQCAEIGVDTIKLSSWGDSMLNKYFLEMIQYAKQNTQLIIMLNTSADRMTPAISEALVALQLDKLSISIDGITRETYEKIRIGAEYPTVLNNINELLNIKKQKNSSFPHITVQIIQMKENKDEIEEFVNYWQNKVDSVAVSNIGATTADKEVLALSQRENTRGHRISCPQLWQRLTVFWDGTITVCCNDFNGILKIGDIQNDRLLDLWHCEKLNQLRQRHLALDFDGLLCQSCTESYTYQAHQ